MDQALEIAGLLLRRKVQQGLAIGIAMREGGNILGLMPHPERVSESILGGEDGRIFWKSILSFFEKGGKGNGL